MAKQNKKNNETERKIHTVDAADKVLGRLAVRIANLLRGKNKPGFVAYKDMGDFVNVANIKNLTVTGKKYDQKVYRHHTGYLGGLKEKSYKEIFEKNPSTVLIDAVWGMLPKNTLRNAQIKRLKIK
jgi:large subunit ribosomal protein L13